MSAPEVRGMLFFRETGDEPRGREGKGERLVMVVGLLAVPEDADIQGEHQAAVGGCMNDGLESMTITALTGKHMIDPEPDTEGLDLGSMIQLPIWRT